jgi:hypothetical protein
MQADWISKPTSTMNFIGYVTRAHKLCAHGIRRMSSLEPAAPAAGY